VGERKCVFDGCNALEFRTTGYCLRHKDGNAENTDPVISKNTLTRSASGKRLFGTILILIGIPLVILGFAYLTSGPHGRGVVPMPDESCGLYCIIPGLCAVAFGNFMMKEDSNTTILLDEQE